MEFFSGLDVGMDETAICVVDDKGKVALQTTLVTDPDAIKVALKPYLGRLRRLGHEAGALSPWLHPELLRLGLAGDLSGDPACARRTQGSAQQDRQGGCARPCPHHAHRALAQRVEVDKKELRIMGAKSVLLRTLVAASSAKTAGFGVPGFVPKWRARRDSNSRPSDSKSDALSS